MMNSMLGNLPKHKAGLSLEHNTHKTYYETVEQWLENNTWCDWESDEAKQKAIDTNEVWTLQWYPNSPIGFNAVAAPTFEDVIRLANSEV